MTSYQLLRLRIIVCAIAGLSFLVQSCKPGFLRAATEPRTLLIHLCLALFGAALLVQSWMFSKHLFNRNPR